MAELNPPTPAFRWGAGDVLRTDVPPRLKERGFIPTSSGTRTVTAVDGSIPEAVIDAGITVVLNTDNDSLYRLTPDGWESVSGKHPLTIPLDVIVGGYEFGYERGY